MYSKKLNDDFVFVDANLFVASLKGRIFDFDRHVFRYRPLTRYAVDDVVESKLTFSSPMNMNDEKDSMLLLKPGVWRDERTKEIISADDPRLIKKLEDLKTYGQRHLYICCFTTLQNDSTMWNRYGSDGSGFMITYCFGGFNLPFAFRDVVYGTGPDMIGKLVPELSFADFEAFSDDSKIDVACLASFYKEHFSDKLCLNWSCEHERRAVQCFDNVGLNGHPFVHLPVDPVAITLGHKCDANHLSKDQLFDLSRLLIYCWAHNIRVFRAKERSIVVRELSAENELKKLFR